jgi:cobalt-zinc-cadmium efflux system membrane fusion protein
MKTIRYLLLAVLFTGQSAFAADEIVLTSQQVQALGITTAKLPSNEAGELAGMPAQVVVPNNQLFVVSTPLAATVEHIWVGVGDAVKKGQLMARLQSPALAEAQRGLMETATQEQLAKDNFTRDEQLWKLGIIAESRYRASRSQYISASAALAERRQMLHLAGMSNAAIARLQSGEGLSSVLEMRSPIDGIVLDKTASAGQRLAAAIPLFTVARLKPLGLEIQLPLAATTGITNGAEVSVPAYHARGNLIAIGHSVSGTNQTVLLRALIHEGVENLRPGQYVEVSIATASGGTTAQWEIPNRAMTRVDGKPQIFVKSAKGFRPVAVNVLHEGAQNTVITGPLNGDETIAVGGVSALKADMMGIGKGN